MYGKPAELAAPTASARIKVGDAPFDVGHLSIPATPTAERG